MNIDIEQLFAIIGRLYTENKLLQQRVLDLTPNPPTPPETPPVA